MGKVIENIALERGHEIVLRKGSSDSFEGLLQADVAIDFSVPTSAVHHISECLKQQYSSYFRNYRLVRKL